MTSQDFVNEKMKELKKAGIGGLARIHIRTSLQEAIEFGAKTKVTIGSLPLEDINKRRSLRLNKRHMNLEQQVCSLDLAKRLKELGVKQESYFYWIEWARGYGKGHMDYERNLAWELRREDQINNFENRCSAFTVTELGEMLPKENQIYSYPCRVNGYVQWDCTSQGTRIMTAEGWEEGHQGTPPMFSETEADARAKFLIYLLENKLITL